MLTEILLAVVQAATEFLPVSSSGHLALVSNLISEPNLFFFTVLHLASLIAVLIFTRREIVDLLRFDSSALKMWGFLIVATIPAALFGYFFSSVIESSLSSYLFLGIAFIFTGVILLLTKFASLGGKLNLKNSFVIGLFQVLALFPGVSRSGMTISSGIFFGIDREKAARFSFLLFIPLVIGATFLELGNFYFSWSLVVSFLVSLILSLAFLKLLFEVIRRGKFWLFSIYCFLIGLVSLGLSFL
ncbi:undecaprenyl-diphosphate phosphatase [archaeon]|jgi:undecaprenyl-diphosphatase|nr:undecaprenyl-diphosphate phosphatase [archaeon]MBT3577994.1 undecaprenyl-diphosphate phosphatase [archaeon]MBT6820597.1 undecaprenyl-diphosphate phosphatase [archaeon]MBT6956532.1 undecaprenyl-diphosphate phosphatase [archaeon]MBT7025848.1 undecaprenyl-diphosphate phosphatase [archaeon]